MDQQRLAEVEAAHTSTDCSVPTCWECAENWPCAMIQLVAEIRRLRQFEASVLAEHEGAHAEGRI